MLISLIITPIFMRLVKKFNVTDKPNHRKVHKDPITTLGGLSICASCIIWLLILQAESHYHVAIISGGCIILVLGFMDDMYNLSPKIKFITQIVAASLVVFWGGLQVEFINLPFGGQVEF